MPGAAVPAAQFPSSLATPAGAPGSRAVSSGRLQSMKRVRESGHPLRAARYWPVRFHVNL